MFKVNNKGRRSGVFIVNFEQISHFVLVQLPIGIGGIKIFLWILPISNFI